MAANNSAVAAASSAPNNSNKMQITGADETATLEQTLLTLFNNMVESIGDVSNVEAESSPSALDAAAFDPSEAMVTLPSLTWLEGAAL